jgi:hypothetical protein
METKKAPPMPNNQDAVTQGWRFDPYPWRVVNDDGLFFALSGSAELAGGEHGNNLARAFVAALNANILTPREQELEAQNKALWELVLDADKALDKMVGWGCNSNAEAITVACQALAKIQTAKESQS